MSGSPLPPKNIRERMGIFSGHGALHARADCVNITRWLFLAQQGDVGGFGAGSQIAWQASGSVGINLTRNIFVETGYRYFYMDYKNGGFLYKTAESGLFLGIGAKF